MLQVARIRCDSAVEVAKPRPFESECPILPFEHFCDPFIQVGSESRDQRWNHSKDRPNDQAMMLLLSKTMNEYEDKNRKENLHNLDVLHEEGEVEGSWFGHGVGVKMSVGMHGIGMF